jgi:hypothetical protein
MPCAGPRNNRLVGFRLGGPPRASKHSASDGSSSDDGEGGGAGGHDEDGEGGDADGDAAQAGGGLELPCIRLKKNIFPSKMQREREALVARMVGIK